MQEQSWYTNLLAKSNQEIARRDMRRRVQSSNKAKTIRRLQLGSVIGASLSINTNASIRKHVGTTFNSAGSSGEAAFMCLDQGAYWCYDDEKFYFSQKKMGVGEEKNNNFVSDCVSYLLDQYWLYHWKRI